MHSSHLDPRVQETIAKEKEKAEKEEKEKEEKEKEKEEKEFYERQPREFWASEENVKDFASFLSRALGAPLFSTSPSSSLHLHLLSSFFLIFFDEYIFEFKR